MTVKTKVLEPEIGITKFFSLCVSIITGFTSFPFLSEFLSFKLSIQVFPLIFQQVKT